MNPCNVFLNLLQICRIHVEKMSKFSVFAQFSPFLPPKVRKFAPVMNFFHTIYLYDIVLIIRNVSHRTGHRKVHKQGTNINN